MKNYGKIKCGAIQTPTIYPGYITIDGRKVFNPIPQQYKTAGYVPILETLRPATTDKEVAIASYRYINNRTLIQQSWTACPVEE